VSEIIDIIDRFWGVSENKAISLFVIAVILLGLTFWKFKQIRHPRYKFRIVIITALILLAVCAYIECWIVFSTWHITVWALGLMMMTAIIMSAYVPIIAYPLLTVLDKAVDAGNTDRAIRLIAAIKLFAFSTTSKLRYRQILSHYYERKNPYEAYSILYNINQKSLFQREINNIEMRMAFNLIQMGSFRTAKLHINNVTTQTPLLLLLEVMIDDACGLSADVIFIKVQKANDLLTNKTDDFVKCQVYANISACRRGQGNYTDALFYAKKAVECAKKQKNDIVIANTYEHLILLMLSEEPENQYITEMFDEYLELLKPDKPNNFIRGFNFMMKFTKTQNRKNELRQIIVNGYSVQIRQLKSLEKYHWEVSMLDVALHADIHIYNIMLDVIQDFDSYFDVKMPDRFSLIENLYQVLDWFLNNARTAYENEKDYRPIFIRCENYLIDNAPQDLETYYSTLNENEVYERVRTLKSMIASSSMKDWRNGNQRFDKLLGNAHAYKNIDESGHAKRIKSLIDIVDMYETNGMLPAEIDAYISIIEECYSVYWLSDEQSYKVNTVNRDTLEKYLEILIDLLKCHPIKRYQAERLKIAAYLHILGREDEARTYYESFDSNELHQFNRRFKNYFVYLKDVLTGEPYKE